QRTPQECIERYLETGDAGFFAQFLHWHEPEINKKAKKFEGQYAVQGHFPDLKQACVQGLLEALDGYEKEKGPFVPYAERTVERAMHDYVRTMRTGCSVPNDTEYYLLRKAMRLFAEHGEKTDDKTVAAIAAAIHREPKTTLEMIQSGMRNMRVLELDREADGGDDEPMEIGSLSDEPSALFFQVYQMDALYDAFQKLDRREREIVAAHLGFCPECFSVRDKDGRPLPKETYEDIMLDFGLSSPDTVEKTCKRALEKIRKALAEWA
ncbi:MAG: sigma-70 family RNA polymerase sigma factor, partial [Clostridium lundense]|nr:sigma-70 family RNA polymerase sigma factor [Clostridium lundense]